MLITINNQVATCSELEALLALPVMQITNSGNEVIVKVQAIESEITDVHKAVLADVFNGQVVALEVEG